MIGCGAILRVGGAGFSCSTFLKKKENRFYRFIQESGSKNRCLTAPQILAENQEPGAVPKMLDEHLAAQIKPSFLFLFASNRPRAHKLQ
jgi:hypothetical protein